jgi:hypothetical protein
MIRAALHDVAFEKPDSHLVVLAPNDFAKTAQASVFRKHKDKPIWDFRGGVHPQPCPRRRKIAHRAVGKHLQLKDGYSRRTMDRLPGTASTFDRHADIRILKVP